MENLENERDQQGNAQEDSQHTTPSCYQFHVFVFCVLERQNYRGDHINRLAVSSRMLSLRRKNREFYTFETCRQVDDTKRHDGRRD